jgi:hypothetical protein
MGRPRKRRLVEQDAEAAPSDDVAVTTVIAPKLAGPEAATTTMTTTTSTSSMPSSYDTAGMSLSFLDEAQTPGLDFFDLLPADSFNDPAMMMMPPAIDPQILMTADESSNDTGFPISLTGVDMLNNINFDEPNASAASMSKDISDSLQNFWYTQDTTYVPEPPESMPSDVSNAAESPDAHSQQYHSSASPPAASSSSASPPSQSDGISAGLKPVPSVPCNCLTNLYYCLDSLSRLPPDIFSAMRVARHATKVAHNTIRCDACAGPSDPFEPPPIQCFQNLMCLAALVPSACNAYAAILETIDQETASAKAEGRELWFSLQDIGGLWGALGDAHSNCDKMRGFNRRNMHPELWRTTMRAILRLDVYGMGARDDGSDDDTREPHYGLKDVVRLLEERSHTRHTKLDELAAQGKIPHASPYLLHRAYKPQPPEERNCMKVLEAARLALDSLVIA